MTIRKLRPPQPPQKPRPNPRVAFQRREMNIILPVYGRLILAGEARDYAIGMHKTQAFFDIHRHASQAPTWRIEKTPALANAQGAYAIIGSGGQILKRGRDLAVVLKFFDRRKFELV